MEPDLFTLSCLRLFTSRILKHLLLNSNLFKKITAIALIFTMSVALSNSFGQKATLLFSKSMLNKTPKMIVFELSDSTGMINPTSESFNQSNMIYFWAKPQEGQDWTLSRKDAEKKLLELKLVQSINYIPTSTPRIILSNDEIKGVILSFPKSQINILKEIKFRLDEYESDVISIPEKLWPGYKKYNDIRSNSQIFSVNTDYFNAFKTLSKLWNKDTLLSKFSFYNQSKDSLTYYADRVISNSNALFTKRFENFKANISEQNLNQLITVQDSILESLMFVDTFLTEISNEIDAVTRKASIDGNKQNIFAKINQAKILFRKKKLSVFEEKSYQDYQLKVYNEAIAKIITSVDKLNRISSFDSVNADKIKSYPSIYKELVDMNWVNDFNSVCKLLNENIVQFGYLFNDTAINNFSQNKLNEPQPYLAIFKAFNALVKKDKRLFLDLVNQAMYAISDKDLLSSLDLYVSLVNNETASSDEYWDLLQKGYNAQISGSLQEAKLSYDKAEKLSNSGEILFFLMAETNLKLGDRYSAETFFKRAVSSNPRFILPKLYQIEFLMDDKDYETALTIVNEALINSPIWYFYYKKALLLGLTQKFAESKTLLLNNCLTLNPLNYDQYLVLGDVYNALGDAKSARESYMKAGSIKPYDKGYKERMETLKQTQETKTVK